MFLNNLISLPLTSKLNNFFYKIWCMTESKTFWKSTNITYVPSLSVSIRDLIMKSNTNRLSIQERFFPKLFKKYIYDFLLKNCFNTVKEYVTFYKNIWCKFICMLTFAISVKIIRKYIIILSYILNKNAWRNFSGTDVEKTGSWPVGESTLHIQGNYRSFMLLAVILSPRNRRGARQRHGVLP